MSILNRLGLSSYSKNNNHSSKVSSYKEILNNKGYNIFLENVSLKNTINNYISSNTKISSSSEADDNTKKTFIRKIIDRILEIWDKFLDWLYRVQIKIVTSRLFKKVSSILEKLKKRFNIYPISIKIKKKNIKNELLNRQMSSDNIVKYTKNFENSARMVKKELNDFENITNGLRKSLNDEDEIKRYADSYFDNFSVESLFNLNILRSVSFYANLINEGDQSYVTIKIKTKEEDKNIRSSLTKQVEKIKHSVETVEREFEDIYKLCKNIKNSVERTIKEISNEEAIVHRRASSLIEQIYGSVNLYTTNITGKLSKIVQHVNKDLHKALSMLESDLSEFLK